MYNKEIINSLSEYYDEEIKTDDQARRLFDHFKKEHAYIKELVGFEVEVAPTSELNANTQSSTLKILAFAQIIKNHTKLFSSAGNGDLEMVKFLVETAKVDVNAGNEFGHTPLIFAARNGHLDVVKYLVKEAKANVNAKNEFGGIALIFAAKNGHLDVVKYLVKEAKANVNARNYCEYTPLIFAAEKGHLGIVKCLVEAKADVNVRNGRRFEETTVIISAICKGHLDVVKCLVKEGNADVNTQDRNGNTPLIFAAERGNLGIVKCLVEEKADVNTKNYYGATALTRTTQDVRKYLKNHVQKINEIELRKGRVCIGVYGAVGFITGFAVAYNAQAAIATCVTSAVTGLLLGAVVGYLAIKVKREKREDPDIGVVTALKNILTIQWNTSQEIC